LQPKKKRGKHKEKETLPGGKVSARVSGKLVGGSRFGLGKLN